MALSALTVWGVGRPAQLIVGGHLRLHVALAAGALLLLWQGVGAGGVSIVRVTWVAHLAS